MDSGRAGWLGLSFLVDGFGVFVDLGIFEWKEDGYGLCKYVSREYYFDHHPFYNILQPPNLTATL